MAMADAAHRAATQQMMLRMQLNASLSSARCIGDPMICVTDALSGIAWHDPGRLRVHSYQHSSSVLRIRHVPRFLLFALGNSSSESFESLGQGVGRIVQPRNVVEIHPSSMVVLPEEEEGVLNVLELVTRQLRRQADGKFGIS